MLLTIRTVQRTVEPPPFSLPLHCVTEVASDVDGVRVVVHLPAAPAAPWQEVSTTTELPTPVATFRLFVTVTVQVSSNPPEFGTLLHCWTAFFVAASAGAPSARLATATKASMSKVPTMTSG